MEDPQRDVARGLQRLRNGCMENEFSGMQLPVSDMYPALYDWSGS